MMLEQSLISPNFLGKESFRWFIGLVTDYRQVQCVEVGGGYKVKVRIIGYHPEDNSNNGILDKDLPWAHVLVPLSMGTGTAGQACYAVPKGGETVIGFFLDGDNAQQPVIIGGLFSGYNVQHLNEYGEGTNKFRVWKPKQSTFNSVNKNPDTGKSTASTGATYVPTSKGTIPTSEGEKTNLGTQITDIGGKYAKEIVNVPVECDSSDSTYSKILQALRNFIQALNTYQQVQNGFINPALSTVSDLPGLAQQVAITISDLFSKYIKKIRDGILKDLSKGLEELINSILPKDIKILKQLATEKIADDIWCAFSKIIKSLGDFVYNFLMQLAGAVTNIPICAAEAFVGSIMSTISNDVSSAIAPALEEFSSNISGTLGEISNYVSTALTYSNQALSFLSCESAECKQVFDYEMNKGYVPKGTIENVQGILNYPNTAIQDGKEAAEQWLGIVGSGDGNTSQFTDPNYGYCDAINLECGLPTIEFFGGAGSGAIGSAVVDAIGQVMGIYIINGGSGYASPPYVSIQDPCQNGNGASATAVITDGVVTSVIMDSVGSGYLNATNSTTVSELNPTVASPNDINPIDSTGTEVIGSVVGINIINTGIGYSNNDVIVDDAYTNDIEIYPVVDPDGRIIDFNIVNPGTAIRVFPELTINTAGGEGAIIQPILSFKPVEKVTTETDPTKINKVVLCAEDHGNL